MSELSSLSTPVLVGIIALIVLQFSLMIAAAVVLLRDRRTTVAGLSKPIWLLIILVGQIPGALAFLVVARSRSEQSEKEAQPERHYRGREARARGVVDKLYRDDQRH